MWLATCHHVASWQPPPTDQPRLCLIWSCDNDHCIPLTSGCPFRLRSTTLCCMPRLCAVVHLVTCAVESLHTGLIVMHNQSALSAHLLQAFLIAGAIHLFDPQLVQPLLANGRVVFQLLMQHICNIQYTYLIMHCMECLDQTRHSALLSAAINAFFNPTCAQQGTFIISKFCWSLTPTAMPANTPASPVASSLTARVRS